MLNQTTQNLGSVDTVTNVISKNEALVQAIQSALLVKQAKNNCYQIAVGLLMRAKVNQHSRELLTFFGDGTDSSNVSAITSWLYELNPLQDSANMDDVSEYLSQYYNQLSKLGINVDY